MADYKGSTCLVCHKEFTEDEDIVVCAECGTPYHRHCYQQEGKCINNVLHENHESWKSKDIASRCSQCGHQNTSLSLYCSNCGTPLGFAKPQDSEAAPQPQPVEPDPYSAYGSNFNPQSAQVNFSDPLCGLNPTEDFDGVCLSELADYVGKNTYYFLPVFKRMKDSKHKFTWNFPSMLSAAFGPGIYFCYRKMYAIAIFVIVLQTILSMPATILQFSRMASIIQMDIVQLFDVQSSSFILLTNIFGLLSYGVMFLCGGFTNWFYYQHCIRKIKQLKEKNGEGQPVETLIRQKGGISIPAVIVLICVPLVLSTIAGILMAFTS